MDAKPDVEERKSAEEALKESEEKYRSLFENMLNGFAYCRMIFDESGKPSDFVYLEINDAFEKLTGLTKENVIGKRITEIIPDVKQTSPEIFEIYGDVVVTGQGRRFEIFFMPLNIWLNISVYRPKENHFAAVFENITERKIVEENLRKSEELLRTIMDDAKDAILLKDKTGRIFFANAEALRMLGKPIWEVAGKTDMELFIDPTISRTIMDADRKAIESKESVVIEETIPTPYGRRIALSTKSPWLDEKGEVKGIIVMATDITERKEMEKTLSEYNQRLEAVVAQRTAEYVQANERLTRELEEHEKMEAALKLRALILDHAREAILLINLKGDLVYANEAATELYGYSQDEFLNMNIRRFRRPEETENIELSLKKTVEEGYLEHDVTHVRKDGSPVQVRVIHSLVKTEHGQFIISIMLRRNREQP
jgi:PAS domain S-box-containing protein